MNPLFSVGGVAVLRKTVSLIASKLNRKMVVRTSVLALSASLLVGCQGALDGLSQKENVPIPKKMIHKMKAYGMTPSSPIMLRIFKEENVLEVWKRRNTGRYGILASYEICKWSGKLGPKLKEGDRQAPEGFYTVNRHQMNPNSRYHLSFNIGYPNAYDRSHERTGSHLMVHGACSSAGCYSMTDERVEIIYALAREAFKGGQKAFQVQAYPFRPTAENMIKHRSSTHYEFWKKLKQGYDHFSITQVPPKVDVCGRDYVFNTISENEYESTGECPAMGMPQSLASAYVRQQSGYALKFEELLAKAERRKTVPTPTFTYQTALPGIDIIAPKPRVPVPAVSDVTSSVDNQDLSEAAKDASEPAG